MSSPSSTRWFPTREQLMILEELYRRGLSNPNASQIQKITAKLSSYGKIQGKNVFYWFQNHKARDRQKLRKKLANQLQQHHLTSPSFNQLFNCYPPQYLYPMGTGSSVEAVEGMMTQTWKGELPKDCLIRTNGHDLVMIVDTNPHFQCFKNTRPLETLELFPPRSPTVKDKDQQTTATSIPPRFVP